MNKMMLRFIYNMWSRFKIPQSFIKGKSPGYGEVGQIGGGRMGSFPDLGKPLGIYKGLEEPSDISLGSAKTQALCAELIAVRRLEDGGHAVGCGEWPGSIYTQIRAKAEELDSLLLLALRVVEAGRPGNRLRLLPLRNTRLAIGFEVSRFLAELEEVTREW
jgi:hypothetical protein